MRQPPDKAERRPAGNRSGVPKMHIGGGIDVSVQRPWPQPSNYSLTPAELARHVRKLRRCGWQSWEINVRFDFTHLDAA